jgi:hypothetical protein
MDDDDEAEIAVVQKGIEFIEKISNINFFNLWLLNLVVKCHQRHLVDQLAVISF